MLANENQYNLELLRHNLLGRGPLKGPQRNQEANQQIVASELPLKKDIPI